MLAGGSGVVGRQSVSLTWFAGGFGCVGAFSDGWECPVGGEHFAGSD